MRSLHGNADHEEELEALLLEKRRQDASDRDIYRSGSAPPTVEGSLSAVRRLLGGASASLGLAEEGLATNEELRSDHAYVPYYYSNANLNPRLPSPLLSREEVKHAKGLRGGGSGGGTAVSGLGGIGDRRKVGRGESGAEPWKAAEWGGDGLIGLPGLGSRQKNLAEVIQVKSVSRHASHLPSDNAFDENVEISEAQTALLHHDLSAIEALRSSATIQCKSSVQNTGSSAAHSYASSLGASLSRSTTPDPQLVARSPSPHIRPVEGRNGSVDKRGVNSPNSLINGSHSCNGVAPGMSKPADFMASFSGMTLSMNDTMHVENLNGYHQTLFNLESGKCHIRQNSYLNRSDIGDFNIHLGSQPIRGSSVPSLRNVGRSPLDYQNVNAAYPSFSDYGLNGYAFNPGSPPIMGNQLGNGNFRPSFNHVADTSAIGISGLDSRALAENLALGQNYMASAAGLENLSRMGNYTAAVPLMDPLYLQYFRTKEYVAPGLGGLGGLGAVYDPALGKDFMANAYMDLLQKAYLGSLTSHEKSQYGVPYLGKSVNLNHVYYGNLGLGLGMAYSRGPMAGTLLPNSVVRAYSPPRHGEQNSRFSSGMRNFAKGMTGTWPLEAGSNFNECFALSLLDEFKSNKGKSFELSEIEGHVVEFSTDQYGSRFIQQKLETATTEEKNMVFHEIMPHGLSLITDVFGNYVVQKFFEHGSASQIRELADQLIGHVLTLSFQMYGCRVIQKALEVVELDQKTNMVTELDGHVMRCVRDQNGNHVIQKCIECIPEEAVQFIVSTFYDQVITLSIHPYGCRIIQRILEHCKDPKTQSIMMDQILNSVCMLAQDQYGNYVIQHVLEHGKPHERTSIIKKLTGLIVQMSQQKFASNVVEKCLIFGDPVERQTLVNEMLCSSEETGPLQVMMKDQFANYVVQKVLETCEDQQLELILNQIKVHLNALKKYTYGKHIVARVEKLVAAGERRIGVLSPNTTAA